MSVCDCVDKRNRTITDAKHKAYGDSNLPRVKMSQGGEDIAQPSNGLWIDDARRGLAQWCADASGEQRLWWYAPKVPLSTMYARHRHCNDANSTTARGAGRRYWTPPHPRKAQYPPYREPSPRPRIGVLPTSYA